MIAHNIDSLHKYITPQTQSYGAIGLELKWPNDIYYQDKKLSSTNELLTARIGLLATAHTIKHKVRW